MATIRTKRGFLYLDYRDEAGKRHRDALFLKDNRENRKKAELEKKKIEYELGAGIYVEKIRREKNRNKTLKEGFEEFKKYKKDREESTIEHYGYAFNKAVEFLSDRPIGSVTSLLIENLDKHLLTSISKNSVASYFAELRHMFDFFKSQGYINYNPFPVRKLKPKKIVTVPEKELNDILQRLKATNRKHYQVIFLYLATGLRRSELVKLQWKDIDLKNNIIAVVNVKDAERIDFLPIYPELHQFLLEEFPEREGRVFDYTRGDSIRKLFARFLKREKFNHYSIHTLRKTYISHLVNSGLTRYDVMALARHKKIETTLRYYTKIDLDRIGREISERAKIGTFLGTKIKQPLKLVKVG